MENRFGFAGEQYDPAANLYYLRARFYNPVIGRFIQEDTYYGDGLNLYTYCHNNPVGYVDPSGHEGICQNKYQAIEYLKEKEGLTSKEALEKYREYRSKNPDLSPEALRNKIIGDTNPNALKYNNDGTWTSNEGLIYGQGSKDGNRVNHVLQHTQPDPSKPKHTVFNVDRSNLIGLIDEAWANRKNPLPSDPGVYLVDMGRIIGTNGETQIRIVVVPGTNNIITAYPQ